MIYIFIYTKVYLHKIGGKKKYYLAGQRVFCTLYFSDVFWVLKIRVFGSTKKKFIFRPVAHGLFTFIFCPFLEYIWWIFFKKWIWYKISSALKNAFWSIRHQVLQSQKVFGNMQNIFSRNRQYMKWWKSISPFKNLQS